MQNSDISSAVRAVIDAVRERGDSALCEFTERWDGVRLKPEELRVPGEAIESADVDTPFARAFARAAARIRRFHQRVRPEGTVVEDEEGVRLSLRWTALRAVGLYVPGGKASYPSTLAMTAVPAQIAGVERIAVVSPPGREGEVCGEVLMAAKILGLDEIYRIGGAQAIAALALGTDTLPRVDKIFGPGNAFVTEAKKQLYGEVGIDVLAGPSELVVYADATANPDWVAADLMAQAEHDEDARVTLLASSQTVLESVLRSMERLVGKEPRRDIIRKAWESCGRFEVVATPRAAARRIDEIAPEHLGIQVADPAQVLLLVRNAGAIYVGSGSPVAVGDYYAGPNHVLPTGAAARYASCLSTEDFMKRSNVAEMTPAFLRKCAEDVEILARGEGLSAHATSVSVRTRPDPAGRARSGLQSVEAYSLVEEDAEVKINQNESPWDVPLELKEKVAARLKDLPWNRYHQKIPGEFLARVARDVDLPEDGILAASGSNLLLQWIFGAYCSPASTVVAPTPSFALYPLWSGVFESNLVEVPLGPGFVYQTEAMIETLAEHRPELTLLCLPNNPTGSELATADVRRIAEAAASVGGVLVIDEAYREFSSPEYDRTALVRELDHVILLRTCSKAFSAAGMRLGYLLASPRLTEHLRKMVPPFHLNLFAAVFGLTVWEHQDVFRERVRQIIAERERLQREVAALPGVEVVPSQANFFLMRVRDARSVYAQLKERSILVRAPSGTSGLENCLRVNAGTPEENGRFLEAIKEILERADPQ